MPFGLSNAPNISIHLMNHVSCPFLDSFVIASHVGVRDFEKLLSTKIILINVILHDSHWIISC